MTKPLRIFLTLVLLSVASAAKANTLYYIVDNIRYAVNTDNSTATVVRNYGYEDMTEITIPASITVDGTTYTVDQIGDHCFSYCSSLTSITIPNSVTQLGDYCFSECTSLTSVNINFVAKLGDYCFSGCSSLTSVTIPSSVTELVAGCFSDCTSLTSVTIPNSVTQLVEACFASCI